MKNPKVSPSMLIGGYTKSMISRSGLIILLTSLVGCSTVYNSYKDIRGTGAGHIYVSPPKVLTRESILVDQSRELTWLDKQLEKSGENTLQGIRFTREFSGLTVGANLQTDSTVLDNYRTAQEANKASIERSNEFNQSTHEYSTTVVENATQINELKLDAQTEVIKTATSLIQGQRQKYEQAVEDYESQCSASNDSTAVCTDLKHARDTAYGDLVKMMVGSDGKVGGGAPITTAISDDDNVPTSISNNAYVGGVFFPVEKVTVNGQDIPVLNPSAALTIPKPSNVDVSKVEQVTKELTKAIETLNTTNKEAVDTAVAGKVNSTPIEHFEDRLAYRNRVLAEINQTRLDDRHDWFGNTLYRFQFEISVLPQEVASSWARVSMALQAPELSPEAYLTLYRRYKSEMGYRLNSRIQQALSHAVRLCQDGKSNALLHGFRERQIREMEHFNRKGEVFGFSEIGASLKSRYEKNLRLLHQSISQSVKNDNASGFGDIASRVSLRELCEKNTLGLALEVAQNVVLEQAMHKHIDMDIQYTENQGHPDAVSINLTERVSEGQEPLTEQKYAEQWWDRFIGESIGHIYAVTPKESSQQISDIAQSSELLSADVAAQFLQSNVGGQAFLNYVNSNQKILQAILRRPIVLGYSGHGVITSRFRTSDQSHDSCYAERLRLNAWLQRNEDAKISYNQRCFGWLVGPVYSINENRDDAEFVHRATTKTVHAELSVPNWLSQVNLSIKTEWLRDHSLRPLSASNDAFVYQVPLPNADKGKFSKLIQAMTGEAQHEAITVNEITGSDLRLREGSTANVIITGKNMVRVTDVTIGGVLADSVSLMPGLDGVRAKFNRLTGVSCKNEVHGFCVAKIELWTRTGMEEGGEAYVKKGGESLVSSLAVDPIQIKAADGNKPLTLRPTGGARFNPNKKGILSIGDLEVDVTETAISEGEVVLQISHSKEKLLAQCDPPLTPGQSCDVSIKLIQADGVFEGDVGILNPEDE